MATKQNTAAYILDQIRQAGIITSRKMFGEYAIYCDEKVVAFVCNDELFVKPTQAGKSYIGEYTEGFPYPGAKPHLLISEDRWDNREWLTELIMLTACEVPLTKKKAKK